MCRIVYSFGVTVFTVIFLFSFSWAQEIEDDVQTLRIFVYNEDEPANWLEISGAIQRLGKKREIAGKDLLLKILKRSKRVNIAKGSPIPGIMSPLDIIKTAAMDALTEIGGTEHREDLYEIAAHAKNHVMRKKAKMNIKRLAEKP